MKQNMLVGITNVIILLRCQYQTNIFSFDGFFVIGLRIIVAITKKGSLKNLLSYQIVQALRSFVNSNMLLQ